MRVAVIGAGPSGLEAAAAALAQGDEVVVYEAGAVGAGVRTWSALAPPPRPWWWGPAGRTLLGRDPAVPLPTGAQLIADWLAPLAAALPVRTFQRVLGVGRRDRFRLVLETPDGERTFDEADHIVDASGAGTWLPAGTDGLALPSENRAASAGRLRYGPVDPDDLPPGPIWVIGGDPLADAQVLALLAAGREVHTAAMCPIPGASSHPHPSRFGRSVEGVTVHVGGDRFYAAQVVTLTGQARDRLLLRALRVAHTADDVVDPSQEPGLTLCGARANNR